MLPITGIGLWRFPMSLRQRLIAICSIVLAIGLGGGCLCWLTGDCVEKLMPPSGPSPADGSVDQPITVTLSWNGSDEVNGNPVRHDVYLSASRPPVLYRPSVSAGSLTVDSLARGRTYYWQVVLIEENGENHPGPVWTFTTEFPPKFLAVVYPNWATSWSRGESRTVSWRSSYAGTAVRIELFKAGVNLCTIASSTSNDGFFSWEMSSCATLTDPDYRIKVTSLLDETLYDYSDLFTVKTGCPIEVFEPHEREEWVAGEVRTIQWRPLGAASNIKVILHLYQGSDFRGVIAPISTDDGAFDWVVSDNDGGSASDYRVRITALGEVGCSQFGEYFAIQACSLRVTSPATNDIWPIGTQQMVTWDTTYMPETMSMDLYRNGEFVCALDHQVPNTGSYLWTVTRCDSPYGQHFQLKLHDGNDGPCGFSGRFDLH